MFCPKCGVENGDETQFCRGCGTALRPRVTERESKGRPQKPVRSLGERAVILYSRGIRGILTGLVFLVLTAVLLARPENDRYWLFSFTVALVVLAGSVSRFVQAAGYKRLAAKEAPPELEAGREEFLRPARSIYSTDDLAASPFSVTERTTNLLRRMDEDDDVID